MDVISPIPTRPGYVISHNGVIKNGDYKVPVWERRLDKRKICRLEPNRICTTVYRLLGQTFVFNPCPKYFDRLDHIDGDCTNDAVDNIRWCSSTLNSYNQLRARGWYKIPKAYNPRTKTFYIPKKPYRAKFQNKSLGCYKTKEEAHAVYVAHRAKEFTRLYMSYLERANVPAEIRHRPDVLRWSQIDGSWPKHSVHNTGVLKPCMGWTKESNVGTVQSTKSVCSKVAPIATKKPQKNINGRTGFNRGRYPRIACIC